VTAVPIASSIFGQAGLGVRAFAVFNCSWKTPKYAGRSELPASSLSTGI